MKRSIELLPCARCGGRGIKVKLYPKKRYDCFYRCDGCGYTTANYTSSQNAKRAWNKMPTEDDKTFGGRIRELMAISGITQTRLAAEIGVSQSCINKIVWNRTEPGMKKLKGMANALGVTVDELLEGV